MLTSFDGTGLFIRHQTAVQPRSALLMVHGLCGHQGRFDDFAQLFLDANVDVWRYDQRGHGQSEGERAYYGSYTEALDDLNAVILHIRNEQPELPLFLYGHSLGGCIAALFGAAYSDAPLRGIVAASALTHDHAGLLATVPLLLPAHTQIPYKPVGRGSSSPAVAERYAADPLVTRVITPGLCVAMRDGLSWFAAHTADMRHPLLVLHGDGDTIVSMRDSLDLFERTGARDRQLKLYGGMLHELYNEPCRNEMAGDILRWMLARA